MIDVLSDNKIDKDKFNEYVENKMNDNTFIEKVFAKCFNA